jgi:hypothetical protein
MNKTTARGLTRPILLVVLAGFALTGCGRSVSGTYVYAGNGMGSYQKLEFESGDTVDLTPGLGPTMQGTYKVDSKKVVVNIAVMSIVFTVDDSGCLDGGGFTGKYCRQ